MKAFLKRPWLVLLMWGAAVFVLLALGPNLSELVKEKGEITIPDDYPSVQAAKILKEMHEQEGTNQTLSTALVFYDSDGLTVKERQNIRQELRELKKAKKQLGITEIVSIFQHPNLKNKLLSKDGTTLLVSLSIAPGGRDAEEMEHALYQALKDCKTPHFFTGDWLIQSDLVESTQEGLHQTEWLTIVFILIVLLLVFRSLVAPLVPLIAVGLTYVVSSAIVAFFVEWFQFPISNFTQIFLVAVLFGIGTDYCILLMNRFREELPRHQTVTEAITQTYRSGGKTMFFSAIAVLVGFSTIGLSTFRLYQSAVGVAVGIAVLIAALLTIVPALMRIFGSRLFWPAKPSGSDHQESVLWGKFGAFSIRRPLVSLLITAAVLTPLALLYQNDVTFNSLEGLGDDVRSVRGFELIADAFGPGAAMPTTVVLKNDEPMTKTRYIETIEAVSREIARLDGVKEVRSVTRPTGEKIDHFFVSQQAQTLNEGLKKAENGIAQISSGLKQAAEKLNASGPRLQDALNGLKRLIAAAERLQDGAEQLQYAVKKLEDGTGQSADGAEELANGLRRLQQAAKKLAEQHETLLAGYEKLAAGLKPLLQHYQALQEKMQKMSAVLMETEKRLQMLGRDHPEIQEDPNYQFSLQAVQQTAAGAEELQKAIATLNENLKQLANKLKTANDGLAEVIRYQKQFSEKIANVQIGADRLAQALRKLNKAQQQMARQVPQFAQGIEQIAEGQQTFQKALQNMGDSLGQLVSGLKRSVSALKQISSGLQEARAFLHGLSESNGALAGYYIPEQALKDKEFQKALDTYLSENRKITTIDVEFAANPYSIEAIKRIDDVRAAVRRALENTPLENARVGIAGVTSTYHDLQQISNSDYTRTVILMFIGIGLILIALLRSFIMPLYLLASLAVTYFAAMGMTELIFIKWLGYSGINWAIPFFGFVMLVVLGVDYSIFLMDRFNEFTHFSPAKAIVIAMRRMGKVIISAAVILGGTFAAMIPSGIVQLMQIATVIICGLFLYNVVVLPLLIPVMVKTFGRANWWPFQVEKSDKGGLDNG